MRNWGDLDHFTATEQLLSERSLDEVLRHAAAGAHVDAEEEQAVVSRRPTVPVFHGEPWS